MIDVGDDFLLICPVDGFLRVTLGGHSFQKRASPEAMVGLARRLLDVSQQRNTKMDNVIYPDFNRTLPNYEQIHQSFGKMQQTCQQLMADTIAFNAEWQRAWHVVLGFAKPDLANSVESKPL